MRIFRDYRTHLTILSLAAFLCADILPRAMGGGVTSQSSSSAQVQPTMPPTQPTLPVRRIQPTATRAVQPLIPAVPIQPVISPVQQPVIAQRPLSKSHTKYTQTQAYFEVPKLRKLVTDKFKGPFEPVKHMDILSSVMAKEAELRDTHWAFYHGTTNVWTLWQDAYTALFAHFNPSIDLGDADFLFLRSRGYENKKAKDLVVETLKEQGLVDDTGEMKAILLSVHLSLFGGTTHSGESTWKYAMVAKSHEQPEREKYESMMDEFGLSHKYIDELMSLSKLLEMTQQSLLQIFVPKNIVDDISYLAWTRGMPAHQGAIDWVQHSGIKGKGGQTGAVRAVGILKGKIKEHKDPEVNRLYKEMLEVAEKGGFSVSAYLDRYCNDPLGLSTMDETQARLVFTDQFLVNPTSGVKMFRYTGLEEDQMKKYKQQLNAVIKKIIATKK